MNDNDSWVRETDDNESWVDNRDPEPVSFQEPTTDEIEENQNLQRFDTNQPQQEYFDPYPQA